MSQALYGELLSRLLGSFIGDQAPQPNPNYLDENKQPVAGQNPYLTPNWGTRFFHPDVAGAEYAGNNAAYSALLADNIKKAITAGNVAKIRGSVGKQLGDIPDNTAAGILFPNLSSEGILSGNTAAAGQDVGLPLLTAGSEAGNAARSIRSSTAALNTGLPENLVDAANASAKYGAAFDTQRMPLIAPSMSLEKAQIGSSMKRLDPETQAAISRAVESDLASKRSIVNAPGLDQAFTSNVDTSVSESNITKQLAAQKEKLLPLLGAIQLSNTRNALYEGQYQPAPSLLHRDTDTGKTVINQDAFNRMQEMQAMLGQGVGGKGPQVASVGSGKSIRLVTDNAPSRSNLIGGSRTNTLISSSAPANSNIKPEPSAKTIPLQSQAPDLSGLDALYKPLIEQFLKRWRAGNLTQHVD